MLRAGDKIRLTDTEKRELSGNAFERANPQTVEEYNTWIDHLCGNVWDGDNPEERLMRAILQGRRISS